MDPAVEMWMEALACSCRLAAAEVLYRAAMAGSNYGVRTRILEDGLSEISRGVAA